MRVTTRFTVSMIDGKILAHEWFEYFGPVALCKGDSTAQAAEQQQSAFDSQLMTIFQNQYQNQTDTLNYLKGKLQPMINNPTGYTTSQLSSMNTAATDSLSTQYQNAQKALNNEQTSTNGGSDLPSGTQEQLDAALLNSEATDKSTAAENISAANANLQQQNYWAAVNALSGNAAQVNPLGYASAATSGSGTVANLSNAVTSSKQSGLMGLLGSMAGGAGTAIGGIYCHVAASFWGWQDIRTHWARFWMGNIAPKWLRNFYIKYSECISKTPARWVFYPVFTYALKCS